MFKFLFQTSAVVLRHDATVRLYGAALRIEQDHKFPNGLAQLHNIDTLIAELMFIALCSPSFLP